MQLILLFTVSCAALLVPKHGSTALTRLTPRVEGQQFVNPDEEPKYKDPKTGDLTPKSRILSGVGPPAADSRWFDWDESCTDATQRQKILSTFTSAMELASWTSEHLQELLGELSKPPGDELNPVNQKEIFDKDQPFAQMFLGLDTQIGYVKETFDLVAQRGQSFAVRQGPKPAALRFICNADNHVLDGKKAGPFCADEDQAITLGPFDPKKNSPTIEPKYSFQTSSSITFCPVFFDDTKFPNLAAVEDDAARPYLDKMDCRERILLHEYMHLPWTRSMRGKTRTAPDEIGWDRVAKLASYGWGAIKINPDN
ncbi:hypothetical protein LTR37_016119 [Vermiconidia calcicola]|uniref:Uncharacterized protein n=1 Tax=Vermiconidia calcicola TaxID=1690605 RepID=A0ACC3MQB7_9PEZI|nr:hypothetical protein LTR37_016119 [Vermiconidia calcicola]